MFGDIFLVGGRKFCDGNANRFSVEAAIGFILWHLLFPGKIRCVLMSVDESEKTEIEMQ